MKFEKFKSIVKISFKDVYITSKFLFMICIICFVIICCSIFIPGLNANENLATIRTLFSSVIGFILETSIRKIPCDDTFINLKNYFIGILAISIIILLPVSSKVPISDTPSLILLKNIVFSCVGFLISGTKNCE